MRGIQFGDYHSADDWGLLLTKKDLAPPDPKTNYVDVTGRSAPLDLSEVLTGDIDYKQRIYKAEFNALEGSRDEREELISDITQAIHGRKLNIIDPDDPERHLVGRVKIKSTADSIAYGILTIEVECDPWRYNNTPAVRSISVSDESKDIILTNSGRKTVLPSLTVTGDISLTVAGVTHELTAGTYKLADLSLRSGKNPITVSGTGTATFMYEEAII